MSIAYYNSGTVSDARLPRSFRKLWCIGTRGVSAKQCTDSTASAASEAGGFSDAGATNSRPRKHYPPRRDWAFEHAAMEREMWRL